MFVIAISVVGAVVGGVVLCRIGSYNIEYQLEDTTTLCLKVVGYRTLEGTGGVVLLIQDVVVFGLVIGCLELGVLELHQDDEAFLLTRVVGLIAY